MKEKVHINMCTCTYLCAIKMAKFVGVEKNPSIALIRFFRKSDIL